MRGCEKHEAMRALLAGRNPFLQRFRVEGALTGWAAIVTFADFFAELEYGNRSVRGNHNNNGVRPDCGEA